MSVHLTNQFIQPTYWQTNNSIPLLSWRRTDQDILALTYRQTNRLLLFFTISLNVASSPFLRISKLCTNTDGSITSARLAFLLQVAHSPKSSSLTVPKRSSFTVFFSSLSTHHFILFLLPVSPENPREIINVKISTFIISSHTTGHLGDCIAEPLIDLTTAIQFGLLGFLVLCVILWMVRGGKKTM